MSGRPRSSRRISALAVPAVLLFGPWLVACSSDAEPQAEKTTSVQAAPASESPTADRVEAEPSTEVTATEYVVLLAEHICEVQGQVYEDPAKMGEAFNSLPSVPGLSSRQVKQLNGEVRTDPDLSQELNEALTATCGEE